MTTREEIVTDITEILLDKFPLDKSEIFETSLLTNDFCIDSLDMVEFTMEIELKFNMTISDELVEEWHIFSDVIDTVYKIIKNKEIICQQKL